MDLRKWVADQFGAGPKKSMPVLSFPAVALLDVSVGALVADPELQARGMRLVAERCPTSAAVSMMDLSVEAEAFGSGIHLSDDEVPTVIGCLAATGRDVDALTLPRPDAGRTGLCVRALRRALELIADRPVFAGVIGPFSLAGRLMDMSELMINCYDEPETVHRLLAKTTAFITSYIREYAKIGAHGVVMAEPAAGLLPPDLFAEFSSAYVREIVAAVRREDFLFIYHNCGNTIPLRDSLFSLGADAWHLGNAVDMAEMLDLAPADALIMGNIDPSGVFRLGNPASVRRDTLALLERCAKYPNWVISSGCDIPPLSPWANIDAYFAAINEFYGVTT